MASPMPPDAPVTSAHFPVRSNMMLLGLHAGFQPIAERRGILRRAERPGVGLAPDALCKPGQDAPCPDLEQRTGAMIHYIGNRFAPAHDSRHLLDQQIFDFMRALDRRGRDIADQWKARGAE